MRRLRNRVLLRVNVEDAEKADVIFNKLMGEEVLLRKNGETPIEYPHPKLEGILAETYGIFVYQEQVMLLSQKLGGFTKGDADVLRKAMGKKQKSVLDKMKAQFIDGATKKNHPAEKLEKIWTDWEAFAQYAFNKSHSTCYE